jgi:hypothetical protein
MFVEGESYAGPKAADVAAPLQDMEPHIAGFHTDFGQGLAAAVGLFVTTGIFVLVKDTFGGATVGVFDHVAVCIAGKGAGPTTGILLPASGHRPGIIEGIWGTFMIRNDKGKCIGSSPQCQGGCHIKSQKQNDPYFPIVAVSKSVKRGAEIVNKEGYELVIN